MHNEHCWILTGDLENKLWWGRMRKVTSGTPCSVIFDADYVLKREESRGDIIGFYHTHPSFTANPSARDFETMRQWVNCFGKSLICVIQGIDGLRGWWFDDDESQPIECQVKRFGSLIIGTTEGLYDPTEGLTQEDDPSFRPVEEFTAEDERAEWEAHVKEINKEG